MTTDEKQCPMDLQEQKVVCDHEAGTCWLFFFCPISYVLSLQQALVCWKLVHAAAPMRQAG